VRLNVQTDTGIPSAQPRWCIVNVGGGSLLAALVVIRSLAFPIGGNPVGGFAGNLAPTGVITSPSTDVLVRVGDRVRFRGDGLTGQHAR